jgi:protein disulfide-isomerase
MNLRIFGILAAGLLGISGCMRGPMREQADPSGPLSNAAPINLNAAIARAHSGNKIVLLDFTGSDWCPPCQELQKEVFSQPEFQAYAESNLVFLVVDFPVRHRLPPDASATNDLLSQKFNIDGFPTLVALDGEGKQIWQHPGFFEGGPKALISALDTAKGK